ncbi:MAG: SPASM domain-containing protein [Nanoarchaeota archaeon]|nr:SPASM domain-containing protein [Nanoarchaeota archaeon]MBU1005490.1 SPASM domain-containing protein [Nanoarchaeota archaeon]MBU1946834.1 SPASM domain-containing protein [Nanoarchaeota archaeon]
MSKLSNYINTHYRDFMPHSLMFGLKELKADLITMPHYSRRDMFTHVAIETTSICDRVCSYCPHSDPELRSQRPQKEMEEDLFRKIIDELALMGYRDKLQLHHYGEPLLDPHLKRRVRYARQKLPEVYLHFGSNGDHLTPERVEGLVQAGIDSILVTNHDKGSNLPPNLAKLRQHLIDNPDMADHVKIRLYLNRWFTRGGLVQIPKESRLEKPYCAQGQHVLTINVDGDVVICSNDYLSEVRLGNIIEQNIMEIWDSKRYRKLRADIRARKFTEDICQRCISLAP